MCSRAAIVLASLSLFAAEAHAKAWCPPPDGVTSPASNENSIPNFDPEPDSSESTSFRGLSLGLGRSTALDTVKRLGFTMEIWSELDRNIDFCVGTDAVGTMRFNESNHLMKLEFRPAFFGVSKIVLREFADAVFEHYQVRRTKVDDDACFADVVCFRGTTSRGEKLLLLRIGTDVMLHIYR